MKRRKGLIKKNRNLICITFVLAAVICPFELYVALTVITDDTYGEAIDGREFNYDVVTDVLHFLVVGVIASFEYYAHSHQIEAQ